jgi:hypothetical protein
VSVSSNWVSVTLFSIEGMNFSRGFCDFHARQCGKLDHGPPWKASHTSPDAVRGEISECCFRLGPMSLELPVRKRQCLCKAMRKGRLFFFQNLCFCGPLDLRVVRVKVSSGMGVAEPVPQGRHDGKGRFLRVVLPSDNASRREQARVWTDRF